MKLLRTITALALLACEVAAASESSNRNSNSDKEGHHDHNHGWPKKWIDSKTLQADISTKKFVSHSHPPGYPASSSTPFANPTLTLPGTHRLMSHLHALNSIALNHGGNRAFGLPGYAASVSYIWNRISHIPGIKTWKQDFPALFGFVESIDLKVGGEDIYVFGLTYSPSTPPEGITAEIVAGPEGAAGCDDSAYEGLDVAGKIVLVQRFRCPTGGTLAGRLLPAARAGAAAVIIYHDLTTNVTAGSLSAPSEEHVPGGFITLADGLRIKERLAKGGKLEAWFQQTQIVETRTTQNVFAETAWGDPDNVIVVCSISLLA
jgi:hypothetical protein